MTATLQERLDEYGQLLEKIGTTHIYGKSFVQSVFLATTLQQDVKSRNDYFTTMGKTLSIPSEKVKRIIALLPV